MKAAVRDLTLLEGIHGTFHYHYPDRTGKHALCGETLVMPTLIPVSAWGVRTHLHERYCKKCEDIAFGE